VRVFRPRKRAPSSPATQKPRTYQSASVGGLNDIVYPALQFGHTLIASQHGFEVECTLDFMAQVLMARMPRRWD
jgi:hypothetical protein